MDCFTPLSFEESWFENAIINLHEINNIVKQITTKHSVTGINKIIWAIRALTLTDLTTLAGDDTKSNVNRLCCRAIQPFPKCIFEKLIDPSLSDDIHVAAVCVYPAQVENAVNSLQDLQSHGNKNKFIHVAAVATGFPTGQYHLKSRLEEIELAIGSGATEIDIVINRSLALEEKWKELYDEIVEMRKVCRNRAHMKTILSIGELGSMENVYKASMVAMMAGSDFIKTSTGKETVNAILPVGLVMINAIQDFQRRTNRKVGFKPAGGIKTVDDSILWMMLIKETLGLEWLQPKLFRIGASGLLNDIENVIRKGLNFE